MLHIQRESRFYCPSGALSLGELLKRTRKVLWAGFILAVAMHLLFTRIRIFRGEEVVTRPLATKFIKRKPRLTKPLELKKRPRPKPRRMHRKVVFVKAKADRKQTVASVQPMRVMENLTKPGINMGRSVYFSGVDLEPTAIAHQISGTKEAKDVVNMSLEMLDIDALDTGKYRAMVIQHPTDKHRIRGFLHLAVVCFESMFSPGLATQERSLTASYIRHVVQSVNRYTDIETDVHGYYTFDSRVILKIPWIFTASGGDAFRLSGSELLNLGSYLTGGGFLFVEAAYTHPWTSPKTSGDDPPHWGEIISIKTMFREGLELVGKEYDRDWIFEQLPADHPVYHCYFDFDGPLLPYDHDGFDRFEFVRGITLDGRLVAMIETGDYEQCVRTGWEGIDGTRFKQFLVNTVIFALIQEGSITQQIMDIVDY